MSVSNQVSFYHATTRKLVTVFGALFKNISIPIDDNKPLYKVPLRITSREKFLTLLQDNPDLYSTQSMRDIVYLGFELMNMNYSSERMRTKTARITTDEHEGRFMYNRVPYDLTFNLYVSAKQLEHAFMVIEQILPIFRPSFNVTINEIKGFETNTDISISLDSVSNDSDLGGAMDMQRVVMFTLGFTMKAYYYMPVQYEEVIKHQVVNFLEHDEGKELFHSMTADVVPEKATRNETHEVVHSG